MSNCNVTLHASVCCPCCIGCVCVCVCLDVCTQESKQAQKTIPRTGRPQSHPPYEYVSVQKPWSISACCNTKMCSHQSPSFSTAHTMLCIYKLINLLRFNATAPSENLFENTFFYLLLLKSLLGGMRFVLFFLLFGSEGITQWWLLEKEIIKKKKEREFYSFLNFWIDTS